MHAIPHPEKIGFWMQYLQATSTSIPSQGRAYILQWCCPVHKINMPPTTSAKDVYLSRSSPQPLDLHRPITVSFLWWTFAVPNTKVVSVHYFHCTYCKLFFFQPRQSLPPSTMLPIYTRLTSHSVCERLQHLKSLCILQSSSAADHDPACRKSF